MTRIAGLKYLKYFSDTLWDGIDQTTDDRELYGLWIEGVTMNHVASHHVYI